jgi:hypothetical protein
MTSPNLAISIISYQRSQLLQKCLESVSRAMSVKQYPMYVVVQDVDLEVEAVLQSYSEIINEIIYVESNGEGVEQLINQNRVKAWETPLIRDGWSYVLCLENDVEVASDIFTFTEHVIKQNSTLKGFWGINYGSFETLASVDTYSRLRFGVHGPASLISQKSFKRFNVDKLIRLKGAVAWDSWVEPLTKTGFMATSNLARYRDNGINGTHANIEINSEYFDKLRKSFELIPTRVDVTYVHKDVTHSWRKDCKVYRKRDNTLNRLKKVFIRLKQLRPLHS